jgi:hypothetical protein
VTAVMRMDVFLFPKRYSQPSTDHGRPRPEEA